GVESIDLAATQGLEVIDGQSVFARGAIRMKDGSTRQYADTELDWSDTVRIDLPDGSTRLARHDVHASGYRICKKSYRRQNPLSLHLCPKWAANDPEYRAAA
ncbi:MAG: hypothetical protein PHD37_18520, partial [Gallionellaceae bacterium]|nr:hypothetical protein [Gallionellaceae bacterium]